MGKGEAVGRAGRGAGLQEKSWKVYGVQGMSGAEVEGRLAGKRGRRTNQGSVNKTLIRQDFVRG